MSAIPFEMPSPPIPFVTMPGKAGGAPRVAQGALILDYPGRRVWIGETT